MSKRRSAQKNVLIEADDLINGERRAEYGPPRICFANIAAQWSLFLSQRLGKEVMLSSEDVCWMMSDFKKVRQFYKKKRDNVRDAAGYIGLIEELDA